MDTERFDLPVAVTLRLMSRSGTIDVIAEPRDDVLVAGEKIESRAEDDGAALMVRCGRGAKPFEVRVPAGTDVIIGTQSGNVSMTGDFGIVSVTTMSGTIEVESADEADLRTGSGNITLERCRGRCRLNTMTGTIEAGRVGAASAGTMSGAIRIDRVDGALKARTVSGAIDCGCAGEGAIVVKTVSGKVHIELPEGTALATRFKTISGRVRNGFPHGADVMVEAMTVSGSIELVPA